MEKLVVIFRKFEDGQVIAIFPTESESYNDSNLCGSYMRVGQHGAAHIDLIRELDKVSEKEYTPLLNELKSIYTTNPIGGDPIELIVKENNHGAYNRQRYNQFLAR